MLNIDTSLELDSIIKEDGEKYTRLVGGFKEGEPIITDLQIAELLDYSKGARSVREQVESNLNYFEYGLHLIDFQRGEVSDTLTETLQSLGYAKQSTTQAKHIYGFSKAGFLLYLKFAEGDSSVNLYKGFIEDYFKTKIENAKLKDTIDEQIEYLENDKAVLIGRAVMEKDETNKILLMGDIETINERLIKLVSKRDSGEIDKAMRSQSKVTESKRKYVNQGDFGAMFNVKIGSKMIGRLLKIVGIAQSSRSKTTPYEHCIPKYANSYVSNSASVPCYRWNYNTSVVKIDDFLRDKGYYEQFYACGVKEDVHKLINFMYDIYVD